VDVRTISACITYRDNRKRALRRQLDAKHPVADICSAQRDGSSLAQYCLLIPGLGGFGRAPPRVPNWGLLAHSATFRTYPERRLRRTWTPFSRLSMPCPLTASESARTLVDVGPLVKSHAQASEKGGKRCSWGSALLLECIARLPERYIETEKRRPMGVPIFTASILPK